MYVTGKYNKIPKTDLIEDKDNIKLDDINNDILKRINLDIN